MDILYVIGACVIIIVALRIYQDNSSKKKVKKFFKENDKYATVIIKRGDKMAGEYVGIEKVGIIRPAWAFENPNYEYYIVPGEHILHMIAYRQPINPFKKKIYTLRDDVKVNLENGKKYEIKYDFSTEKYTIESR